MNWRTLITRHLKPRPLKLPEPDPATVERLRNAMEHYVAPTAYKCNCACHHNCHTCGRPIINGRYHINCEDTMGGSGGQMYRG